MAISYRLELATTSSVAHVAQTLADVVFVGNVPDADAKSAQILHDGATLSSGMWVRVTHVAAQEWDPIVTDLGFSPTVAVTFRMDKFAPISAQQDAMVQLTSAVLAQTSGDAVLHFQLETIWLLRHHGELSVNERHDLWPPERLSLLSSPYRRATHTFS